MVLVQPVVHGTAASFRDQLLISRLEENGEYYFIRAILNFYRIISKLFERITRSCIGNEHILCARQHTCNVCYAVHTQCIWKPRTYIVCGPTYIQCIWDHAHILYVKRKTYNVCQPHIFSYAIVCITGCCFSRCTC